MRTAATLAIKMLCWRWHCSRSLLPVLPFCLHHSVQHAPRSHLSNRLSFVWRRTVKI